MPTATTQTALRNLAGKIAVEDYRRDLQAHLDAGKVRHSFQPVESEAHRAVMLALRLSEAEAVEVLRSFELCSV